MIFSRSETAGFTVPRTWGEGSCVVAIDVDGDGVEETSTFRAITERAWALMLACVIMEPHLGGRTRLGEHEMMSVLVYNPVEGMICCYLSLRLYADLGSRTCGRVALPERLRGSM